MTTELVRALEVVEKHIARLESALRGCWDEYSELMPNGLYEQVRTALDVRVFVAEECGDCARNPGLCDTHNSLDNDGCTCLPNGPAHAPTCPALLDETVRPLKVECCRECRDLEPPVHTRAEFILWGKLFPAEALGPRCYDHAAKHLGWAAMSRINQYAVYDLRPINARFLDDIVPTHLDEVGVMTEESVIVEAWREAMGRADYPDMDLRDLAALFLTALQTAGFEVVRAAHNDGQEAGDG